MPTAGSALTAARTPAARGALATRARGPTVMAVAAAADGVATVAAGTNAGGRVPEPVPAPTATAAALATTSGWGGAEFVSECGTSGRMRRVAAAAPSRTRGGSVLTTVACPAGAAVPRRDAPRAAVPACSDAVPGVMFGVATDEASSSLGAATATPAAGVAANATPRAKAAAPARAPRLFADIDMPLRWLIAETLL